MNFWTFVFLIVIFIGVGDFLKKSFKGSQSNNEGKSADKDLEELKSRIDELDKFTKYKIEKRLQAIESIVVDSEYNLEMKFKRVIGDE